MSKGSESRITNWVQYRENWERIFGDKKPPEGITLLETNGKKRIKVRGTKARLNIKK